MKLLSALLGFMFIIAVFTVIAAYTTTIVLYTVDKYLEYTNSNILIYVEKNIASEYL